MYGLNAFALIVFAAIHAWRYVAAVSLRRFAGAR